MKIALVTMYDENCIRYAEIRIVVYTGKPVVQDYMTVYPVTDKGFMLEEKEYQGQGIRIESPAERTSYIFKLERIK